MEIKLIKLVQENSYLYDRREESYRDIEAKTKKWQEISKELNVPVDKVKQRWGSLRDRYHREKKEIAKGVKSIVGNADVPTRCWKYFYLMRFLDNIPKKNLSTSFFKPKITSKIQELNVSPYLKEDNNSANSNCFSERKIPFVEEFVQSFEEADIDDEYVEENSIEDFKDEMIIESTINQDENVDDLFCRMLSASLKSLSRVNNMKAKTEIFQILEKYVEREEGRQNQ